MQAFFHVDQLGPFLLDHAGHRHTCPRRDDLGDIFCANDLRDIRSFAPCIALLNELCFEFQEFRPEYCRFLVIALLTGIFFVRADDFELLFQCTDLFGHAEHIDADFCGSFVEQVDSLVRQKAVHDEAVRQAHCGIDGFVADGQVVMGFVAVAQPLEHCDCRWHIWLFDKDRTEATLQCRIFLDVFAVFVERRGADDLHLAACQRWFEHIGCVYRSLCCASTDDGMEFVNEQNNLSVAPFDLVHHGLEAFLKLAAELGPSHHGPQIERHDFFVEERLRHRTVHNHLRQTFGDGGFADTRFTHQYRIVFGTTTQYPDNTGNLGFTPYHGIEFAFRRHRGEVCAVFGEYLIFGLGVGGICPLGTADLHQGLIESLLCNRKAVQYPL